MVNFNIKDCVKVCMPSTRQKVSRHLSQTLSDLRQELLSSGTHGAKSFHQGHWKKVVGPAERAVFVCLPSSCSLSRTGLGNCTLLEVSTT